MYARRVEDQKLTFDFAEGLVKNNLLIVDRETRSIWSQLDSKAIDGPLKGTPLKMLPAMQTTWKFWRETHPGTKVWIVKDEKGRPYYYRNSRRRSSKQQKVKKHHDTSNLGLGLAIKSKAIFFPFQELNKMKIPFELEIAGSKVTIHYNNKALTAWAEDANGELLTTVLVYQDGWLGFYPNSQIIHATDFNNK